MADFPPEWTNLRPLPNGEGGQAHTFLVKRADGSDDRQYVLKRLKNPQREDRFKSEIEACKSLKHPNILPPVEYGYTPAKKPFLISGYCEGGSLQDKRTQAPSLLDGLERFRQIVSGVAFAHRHIAPVYHLDLKPKNIFLKGDAAVVGDFGLCVIADGSVEFTQEGQRGSRYYCAPELRSPKLNVEVKDLGASDVYSLGKILYWIFTGDVFDGSEDDYTEQPERRLGSLLSSEPAFAFVDELIETAVIRKSAKRLQNASTLLDKVDEVINRVRHGGRVLDTNIPKLCLFCGKGHYQLAAQPPLLDRRLSASARNMVQHGPSVWGSMYTQTLAVLGMASAGRGPAEIVPLHLICDYCGNLQSFRWDIKVEAIKNWKP